MNVFEGVSANAKAILSQWIKVVDPKSTYSLDSIPHGDRIDDTRTDGHCWRCVTVNQCWFKNEYGKKPEHFDYSKYSFGQIALSKRGLYHPNCHDKELSINAPQLSDIELISIEKKIKWFFSEKSNWFYSWGYENKDKDKFISNIISLTKQAYRYGNYKMEKHTEAGFQINLSITINGINEKKNKNYELKTCYIIFPHGKLRLVTLVGGWR